MNAGEHKSACQDSTLCQNSAERGGGAHRFSRSRAKVDSVKNRNLRGAGPADAAALHLNDARRAGASDRLGSRNGQDRRSAFDGAAKTVPPGKRNAAQRFRRSVAQIENDHSESSTVKNPVGGLEGAVGFLAAAHPQESFESDSVIPRGGGVEGIGAIDVGADFSPAQGFRQHRMQKSGAAGGWAAQDLGDRASGQPEKRREMVESEERGGIDWGSSLPDQSG